MTSSRRLCYCGNFPELQSQFIRDVSRQRDSDPLALLTVIVRGPLVGLALRRELAWAGCPHANVGFVTLSDLAAERADKAVAAHALRRLNDVTRDAIMAKAIEMSGRLEYFSEISSREGFRRAVWKTLDGLRSAGITIEMLHALSDRLTHPVYETLRCKLSDLVAVRENLDQCMKEHRLVDTAAILELAAHERPSDASAPIIFYGLTELSELETRFVESLLDDRTVAYLPYRNGPACQWVKPLFDTFCAWTFEARFLDPLRGSGQLLSRVQLGLFEEITPVENSTRADDISLLIVSAPSREREAEETMSNVLYSPLVESHPARCTAILVRESAPYTGLLRSSLEHAGIHGYFYECQTLADTTAGRAVKLLVFLLDEKFRRAIVMQFLLSTPVKWPDALVDPLPDLPVAEWNQFSLLAGIVSGRNSWLERLVKLRNRLLAEQDRSGDEEDEKRLFRAERLGSLNAMTRYLDYFFTRVAEVNRTATWRDRVVSLQTLVREFIAMSDEDAAVLDRLSDLEDLDALKSPLTLDNTRQRIGQVLSQSGGRSARFQIDEPTVAPMNASVGILFDEVMIPGMVEKEIPRPIPADPLLLDDERDILQKLLSERRRAIIPNFKREHERELFLFHTALNSARKRLVLSYPRRDESSSRERLPSSYLLKAVEAAVARTTDYAGLETFIANSSNGRRIPVSRLQGTDPALAVTSFHYHEAMLESALKSKSCFPLLYLIEDHPFFARGVEAELLRHRERNFSRYDGMIQDPILLQRYLDWAAARWPTVNVGHLEQYATCPFRYFAARVLDIEGIEEPPELQRITPYERGILMRGILHLFYRSEKDADRLPLTSDAMPRLREIAEQRFAQFERESNTGAYLLWRIDHDRMLHALTDFVADEIADTSGYVPTYFGNVFKAQADVAASFPSSGRLDRIDVSPEGKARVVNYKTGKPRDLSTDGSLFAGRALHLPIYRLAAESIAGVPVDSAADYYVAAGIKIKKSVYSEIDWQSGRERFLRTVEIVRHGIAAGEFFPFPEQSKCEHCPVRAACGAGRLTVKWNYDLEQTRTFRTLGEVR